MKIVFRSSLFGLLLSTVACGGRPSTTPADSGLFDSAALDLKNDSGQPPALPWVSRYAGSGECYAGLAGAQPRLTADIASIIALRYDAERGLLVGTGFQQVLEIRGDNAHWLAGTLAAGDIRDGAVEDAKFGSIADLVYEDGRVWVAERYGIRVIEKGVVETIAGTPNEHGEVVDGKRDVARFARVHSLAFRSGLLFIGDGQHIRTYESSTETVTTVAGNGEVPSKDSLPPEGAALEVPVVARHLAVLTDGLLFNMEHQLGVLSNGEVTTIARSRWTDVGVVPNEDGELGTATFNVGAFALDRERIYFGQEDALRVIDGDQVYTLSSRSSGRQDDAPLDEFQFERISAMTSDLAGNLYIGDGCVIWRVQLR